MPILCLEIVSARYTYNLPCLFCHNRHGLKLREFEKLLLAGDIKLSRSKFLLKFEQHFYGMIIKEKTKKSDFVEIEKLLLDETNVIIEIGLVL